MRRRFVLSLSAAAVASLAGCGRDDGGDAGSGSPDSETDGTTTGAEGGQNSESRADGEPDLDYTISADVPAEVEVDEEFTFGAMMRNEGEDMEATFGLDVALADREVPETLFNEEITLRSGGSESFESGAFASDEAGTILWEFYLVPEDRPRVMDAKETVVQTPTRSWGEPYQTSTGLAITASNPRFESRYEYTGPDGERNVHRAGEGEKFVFIDFRVENNSGTTRTTPKRVGVGLVATGVQFEPMSRTEYERDDMYDGSNEIVDGFFEEGVLPFVVPSEAEIDGLRLFHSGSDVRQYAAWNVIWRA
ncbi:hypothetical protein KM295_06675 [Natronomonas sp. F2-12]|uniref:Uncharacterized protein n=1 Tax=Natronomonas aquatica TaxID=2841590 RepID=A0A9R1CSG8_9EURY|nr:hypothetical protein [Natronomonas aquatica]